MNEVVGTQKFSPDLLELYCPAESPEGDGYSIMNEAGEFIQYDGTLGSEEIYFSGVYLFPEEGKMFLQSEKGDVYIEGSEIKAISREQFEALKESIVMQVKGIVTQI